MLLYQRVHITGILGHNWMVWAIFSRRLPGRWNDNPRCRTWQSPPTRDAWKKMWKAVVFHDLHMVGEATSSEIINVKYTIPQIWTTRNLGCSPVMRSENIWKNPTKMEISPPTTWLGESPRVVFSTWISLASPCLVRYPLVNKQKYGKWPLK